MNRIGFSKISSLNIKMYILSKTNSSLLETHYNIASTENWFWRNGKKLESLLQQKKAINNQNGKQGKVDKKERAFDLFQNWKT